MIGNVVPGPKWFGIIRILRDFVEVYNSVECAARTDPGIYSLANGLAILACVGGADVGCQRASDHLDAMRVRTFDHLAESAGEVVRRNCVRTWLPGGNADVVDAFHDHEPFDAGLAQHEIGRAH